MWKPGQLVTVNGKLYRVKKVPDTFSKYPERIAACRCKIRETCGKRCEICGFPKLSKNCYLTN